MLKDKVIFILSLMKFDGLHSSNFTIAKYLAKHNEVYYMEHPMTWKDYIAADKSGESFKLREKAIKFKSNGLLDKKIDGVNILLSHPLFPLNSLPKGPLFNFFHRTNEKLIARRFNKLLQQRNIKEFIFINAYEFQYPTINKYFTFPPEISVYYCVDPIPDYHKKHGVENEKKLIENSDVVICTSKALFKEKGKLNNNCYFVPNGADLVETIDIKNLKAHKELNVIRKPIIGYIGAIERRIDYILMQEVIELNSDKNFVFVGPLYKENLPEWFFNQKNIHFIPSIPYDEVPDMIFGFDVCMIPFKKDKISDCIFPLKLFEYLGAAKPVVVTNFNEDLKEFTYDLVEFSSTAEEFSKTIDKSLKNNNVGLANARIELAKKNTWQNRADMISQIIDKNL